MSCKKIVLLPPPLANMISFICRKPSLYELIILKNPDYSMGSLEPVILSLEITIPPVIEGLNWKLHIRVNTVYLVCVHRVIFCLKP